MFNRDSERRPGDDGRQPAPVNPGKALIEMRSIVKTFKTSAGEFTALKGIEADFYPGEFVSVVGKSGSGKSTLANMITGIDRPTSGSVCIDGTCVQSMTESQMSAWRGRSLGIVFQFFQLLPMLTLQENVLLPMDFCNQYPPGEREARALELLDLVGLAPYADKLPAEVSGGQQQTAAIARALANDPPILIADEPTGNLDSHTAEAVFSIFEGLVQQGKTILMVTHDSSLASRTDRTLLLSDGELINDRVASAFPGISHRRLLWLTHRVRQKSFLPGENLPRPDGQASGLYLITSGAVELVLNGRPKPVRVSLGPGEVLSPHDLEAYRSVVELHAAHDAPVDALVLEPADFKSWLEAAPLEHSWLQTAAQQRLAGWTARDQDRLA